jgi:hypothetical protein
MTDQQELPPVVIDGAQMEKINNLIDTFNQQHGSICDAECRNNRYLKDLYEEYMAAENNLRAAPSEVETAEENYYVAEKGTTWYSNFKMNKATKQSDDNISKIDNNLENIYNSIKKDIDYYGSQVIYRKRLGDMINTQTTDLQKAKKNIKDLDAKRNIANRLSVYYANDIKWVNSVFYTTSLRLFYWILAIFITIRVLWLIYKRVYVGYQMRTPLKVVAALLFIPSLLTTLVRFSIRRNHVSWGKNLIL